MATDISTMRLSELEGVIDRLRLSFIDAGMALAEIRDGRMYGSEYETFEDYCDKRWGFTPQRAYQLIDASKTMLEMSTIVDITTLPQNEAQVRALNNVAETTKEKIAVMKKAAKDAPKDKEGNPKITAAEIKKAAAASDPEADRKAAIMGAQRTTMFDPVELEAKSKSLVVDTAKPLAEQIAHQVKMIESFCRSLVKFFDDNLPSDPWLDEGQVEIARSQLKSCCGAIRVAKAHDKPCPKCDGKGCKTCRKCGYMPKMTYEMNGGK
jgi:hypothetical protein